MTNDRARRAGVVALLVALFVAGAVVGMTFTSDPATVDGTIPLGADNGPTVILETDGQTDVNLEDAWNTSGELDIETESGNITVGGDPGANATIHVSEIEGTTTRATNLSGGSDWLYLNPYDKQRVDVRGDVDAIQFQSVAVDDGSRDLTVEGTDGGTAELAIHDLTAGESYALADPTTGQVLATADADGSGVLSTTMTLDSASQPVAVRTQDSYAAPTVSNPTPDGEVTELPDELSVDVDADAYPADVTFTLEGSEVGTVTMTEDGTATTSVDVSELGTYNWSASVEDGVGQTDSVDATFETPAI